MKSGTIQTEMSGTIRPKYSTVCRGLSGSYNTEAVVQFAANRVVLLPAE